VDELPNDGWAKYQFSFMDPMGDTRETINWFVEHNYVIMYTWLDPKSGQVVILWQRVAAPTPAATGGSAAKSDFEIFRDMLSDWLVMNTRSPLDGTTSCNICRAIVLSGHNDEKHKAWHLRVAYTHD
jgi:hypothetical protein